MADTYKACQPFLPLNSTVLFGHFAAAKLREYLGLKKEHILYFLHQLSKMDLKDIDCQRRLIKTFVNAVFVYDDKVVLTFHYSSDDRTITLNEIDGELQHGVCMPPSAAHQKSRYPTGYLLFCTRAEIRKNICNAQM